MSRATRRHAAARTRREQATLTIAPAPRLGPDAVRFTLDCAHSRTVATLVPPVGGAAPTPAEVLGLLLMRRAAAGESCPCVRPIALRYGAMLPAGGVLWLALAGGEGAA